MSAPALFAQEPASQAAFRIEEASEPAGWNIFKGDKLVAGYIFDSNGKPIVYPVVGPAGHRMTRNFPMQDEGELERGDHDHHRSMWLTHGDVNGTDFWLDDENCGKIVHRKGTAELGADGEPVLITENDWLDAMGNRLLSDTRRLSIRDVDGRRIIDCDFLLKATDGDVNFGDTKEGTFGVRLAGTMKVDAKLGGLITNAAGETNKEAWGQKSAWVNYSGPIDGDTVGMVIHDHPSSFGFPCRWHVRTYGLFAANPFGVSDFTGGDKTKGLVLPAGKQMRLNYRVVLYTGDFDPETVAEDSRQYANDPRPFLE